MAPLWAVIFPHRISLKLHPIKILKSICNRASDASPGRPFHSQQGVFLRVGFSFNFIPLPILMEARRKGHSEGKRWKNPTKQTEQLLNYTEKVC